MNAFKNVFKYLIQIRIHFAQACWSDRELMFIPTMLIESTKLVKLAKHVGWSNKDGLLVLTN